MDSTPQSRAFMAIITFLRIFQLGATAITGFVACFLIWSHNNHICGSERWLYFCSLTQTATKVPPGEVAIICGVSYFYAPIYYSVRLQINPTKIELIWPCRSAYASPSKRSRRKSSRYCSGRRAFSSGIKRNANSTASPCSAPPASHSRCSALHSNTTLTSQLSGSHGRSAGIT